MRVAVAGAGAMGRLHARVYREIPGVTLAGIADPDPAAVAAAAELHGVVGYADVGELLDRERPDAISVVTPTSTHLEVARQALERGVHVLVEKPIAPSVADALALIEAARRAGVLLMVGHIERFNVAVQEARRRIEAGQLGRIFQVNARRIGPFPQRIRDVGVVVDLATHDIDVMRFLVGSEPVRVFAETRQQVHTSCEDLLTGVLSFAGGAVGVLEVNWLTPAKLRQLSVTGERGMFVINYLTQDLEFYENREPETGRWEAISQLRGVQEGSMTRYALAKREPLRTELEAFLAGAAGNRQRVVTGEDGLAVLRVALALVEAGLQNRVVHAPA